MEEVRKEVETKKIKEGKCILPLLSIIKTLNVNDMVVS